MSERLQKVLASAGVASRRACEDLIRQGKVKVNGQPAELGCKVDPSRDRVEVEGRPIVLETLVYYMLHKPAGILTTVTDPRGRPAVLDLVQVPERIFPVGRLDKDTEGLLLLTNDGPLAHALLHPSKGVRKRYLAMVKGTPPPSALDRLQRGVKLEDGLTAPCRVCMKGSSLVQLDLKEGRKRQVRRMLMAVGFPVLHLKRVRFGPLELGDLPLGQWRALTPGEVSALQGVARAAAARPPRRAL